MSITWKVIHNLTTPQLEEKLNELAAQDYDIYRLEFVQSSVSESGSVPMQPAQSAPVYVNVTPPNTPSTNIPNTFTNNQPGYAANGNFTKTRTLFGTWIIIACRVES